MVFVEDVWRIFGLNHIFLMLLFNSGSTEMPHIHIGHSVVCVDSHYCGFVSHVFSAESVTTIVMGPKALIDFARCIVHENAVVVVSGGTVRFYSDNQVHPTAKICGAVDSIDYCARVDFPVRIESRHITIFGNSQEDPWSEKELDMLERGCRVLYLHGLGFANIPTEHRSRFIARMRINHNFYVSKIRDLPYDLATRDRRLIAHAMLVIVSAKDAKRVGSKSALRKLPWYLLKISGEMLW